MSSKGNTTDNEELSGDEDGNNLSESNGNSNEKGENKSKSQGTKKWTPFETQVFIHGLRKYECFITIRAKLIDKLCQHMLEHEVCLHFCGV